jgi:hypothetical protein
MSEPEIAYHLILGASETPVAASALRLFLADEAHQPQIRSLVREVLAALDAEPAAGGALTVGLTPQQMKITHSALKLLHDDLGREQADERAVLRRILDKLPDEHTMRAIEIE